VPKPLRISGATPRTLLGYLVGLGLLRIVARQTDPAVRACWRDNALELHAAFDASGLERFLLDRWVPAPVVSPWNGGSGFFPSKKKGVAALASIEEDRSPRLDSFRATIAAARGALRELGLDARPEPKAAKPALLRKLRATLADDALEWLDAAIVLVGDETAFPPVLGIGGGDGNFDVANNYAQAVVFALAVGGDERRRSVSATALSAMLWGASATLRQMSLGHLARDASPVNSPAGASEGLANPWELVMAVEGTLVFAAGAGRRLETGADPDLVAPFTMNSTSAGYGSAVAGERGRAELWLPVWEEPATLAETETLFREARLQVGRRSARTGLDGARAAAELGVARGIVAFERLSILERAGQGSHVAVPAGRVEVRERPAARALRTLDPWLGRLVRQAGGDVPRAQREAIGTLERASYAVAERGASADVRALLAAVGRVEGVLSLAARYSQSGRDGQPGRVEPIAPAAGPWLAALDLASVETRLAVGIGSLGDAFRPGEARLPALRDYLHATGHDARGRRRYGETTAGSVPSRAGAVARLAAVHERRHQDAARAGRAELGFDHGIGLALADLGALVAGCVDERELGALVDGLSLLDYRGVRVPESANRDRDGDVADPLLAILALAFRDPRPAAGPDGEPAPRCRPRPGWVARLRAGRVREVAADALLRLRMSGHVVIAEAGDLQTDVADGTRLAAALLGRPRAADLWRAARAMTLQEPNPERQETAT
jgi:CRISPR-associated protein Csx17